MGVRVSITGDDQWEIALGRRKRSRSETSDLGNKVLRFDAEGFVGKMESYAAELLGG